MPQPTKIPRAFADSGDKNSIPDSSGDLGYASWREGFPAICSQPFSEGGVAPKRADFNGIFNALSAVALWYQQGGVFVYDNATNYEIGNIVIYSGEIYVCKTANGPASALHSPADDTAESYWGRLYPQNGTFDRVFFSQASGTYTAPRTGVYRITLKGGGGGGGGAQTTTGRSGGGGGEGAINIFYLTLTKNATYSYSIGAGGAGGASGVNYVDLTSGSAGGSTIFTIDNLNYVAFGGNGGAHSQTQALGGLGGGISASTQYGIPGANGFNGAYVDAPRPLGGGHRGAHGDDAALYGGGGGGATTIGTATAGAPGYILIEYAG